MHQPTHAHRVDSAGEEGVMIFLFIFVIFVCFCWGNENMRGVGMLLSVLAGFAVGVVFGFGWIVSTVAAIIGGVL